MKKVIILTKPHTKTNPKTKIKTNEQTKPKQKQTKNLSKKPSFPGTSPNQTSLPSMLSYTEEI